MALYGWKKYSTRTESYWVATWKDKKLTFSAGMPIFSSYDYYSGTGFIGRNNTGKVTHPGVEAEGLYIIGRSSQEDSGNISMIPSKTAGGNLIFRLRRPVIAVRSSAGDLSCYGSWASYAAKSQRTVRGDFLEQVTSSSRNAYPDNGAKGAYFYEYIGEVNQAPTITTTSTALGVLTKEEQVLYTVSDPDGDMLTVEVSIDEKPMAGSPFAVKSGTTRQVSLRPMAYTLGEHKLLITATDPHGAKAEKLITFSRGNQAPTISGEDEDLGNQNSGFQFDVMVDDPDGEDRLRLEVRLNDEVLRTIDNAERKKALTIRIPDEKVLALEIGKLNTVTLKLSDDKGAEVYRYKYFKRSNSAPILDPVTKDLGAVSTPPELDVKARDLENDPMTYQVFLEEEALGPEKEVSGDIRVRLSKKEFARVPNHRSTQLRVVVKDNKGAASSSIATFERRLSSCYYIFKKEVDAKPQSLYLDVNAQVAEGATLKVYASNNAKDSRPTWEEITEKVKGGRPHVFTNGTKTASHWAIGTKVEILPGTSEEPSWILGIGGGYK